MDRNLFRYASHAKYNIPDDIELDWDFQTSLSLVLHVESSVEWFDGYHLAFASGFGILSSLLI
jgi:hypothetical protein